MSDLIDREAVRLAKVPYDEQLSMYERGWNDACEAIADNAPPAPRWVRCEERLPDEAGDYIVAYHPRRWESINMEMKVGIDKYRDGKWAERNYRWVTHWMPLPEPPKEDA